MSEQVMDEGLDEDQGAKPTEGRKVDPSFARNMKVVGGVILIAVLAVVSVVFSLRSKSESNTNVNVAATRSAPSQANTTDPTPAMQDKLKDRQAVEANAAAAAGKTYVPKESIGTTEKIPDPTANANPGISTMQQTNYAVPQADPADAMRREGLKRQLAVMFPSSVTVGAARQTIEADKASTAAAGATGAARQSVDATQNAANTPAVKGVKVITALDILPGEMANPINVGQGKSSFASARVTAGKFAGAYLIGTATLNDEEAIETRFTNMKLGNQSYKIDAIVLDEQTADAGLRGDIDRRILARYVLPMTLGVVQGYVTAKAQTGSTVIIGAGGATSQNVPPPTEEQAVNAGIAVGLQQAQTDIQKEAQKPIRGATKRGAPMGILFRADVIEGSNQ